MKKKMMLLFCIMSCVLMVSGCSLIKGNENFDKKALKEQTDTFIKNWFAADFSATLEAYKDQMDEEILAQYQDYAKLQKKYKAIKKIVKTEYTINSDSATVTETVLCENGKKVLISLSFDEKGNIQMDEKGVYVFKFDEYKTLGQKMSKAGLNTVLSMAIVFCVLIFIAWIISGFSLIGKWQDKASQTQAETARTSSAPAPSAPAPSAPAAPAVNLTDDLELVAVITAAIAAASETESTDGLVIRSIIRR